MTQDPVQRHLVSSFQDLGHPSRVRDTDGPVLTRFILRQGHDVLQREGRPDSAVGGPARSTPDPLKVIRPTSNDGRSRAKHRVVSWRTKVGLREQPSSPLREGCVAVGNARLPLWRVDALPVLREVPTDEREVPSDALSRRLAPSHPDRLRRCLKSRSRQRVGGPDGVLYDVIRMELQGGNKIRPHHQVLKSRSKVLAVPVRRLLVRVESVDLGEAGARRRIADPLEDPTGHTGTVSNSDPRLRDARVNCEP